MKAKIIDIFLRGKKNRLCCPFPLRFPCAYSATAETHKAFEPAVYVAGFEFHLKDCGPPNLLTCFFASLIINVGMLFKKRCFRE